EAPPILLAQTKLPSLSSLVMKASVPTGELRLNTAVPGSKSAVPLKCPVIRTLPEPSTTIAFGPSFEGPPNCTAQMKLPEASDLLTKMSGQPTPSVAVRLN